MTTQPLTLTEVLSSSFLPVLDEPVLERFNPSGTSRSDGIILVSLSASCTATPSFTSSAYDSIRPFTIGFLTELIPVLVSLMAEARIADVSISTSKFALASNFISEKLSSIFPPSKTTASFNTPFSSIGILKLAAEFVWFFCLSNLSIALEYGTLYTKDSPYLDAPSYQSSTLRGRSYFFSIRDILSVIIFSSASSEACTLGKMKSLDVLSADNTASFNTSSASLIFGTYFKIASISLSRSSIHLLDKYDPMIASVKLLSLNNPSNSLASSCSVLPLPGPDDCLIKREYSFDILEMSY